MMMTDDELRGDFLSIQQAAKLLGVSRGTVSRLIETERLKAIKLGPRQTRIPRTAIDSLAE
jgi:excisionase family DNA binding protein